MGGSRIEESNYSERRGIFFALMGKKKEGGHTHGLPAPVFILALLLAGSGWAQDDSQSAGIPGPSERGTTTLDPLESVSNLTINTRSLDLQFQLRLTPDFPVADNLSYHYGGYYNSNIFSYYRPSYVSSDIAYLPGRYRGSTYN